MTIKHIQDSVENCGMEVARDAYLLGLRDAQKIYSDDEEAKDKDQINDDLQEIVKTKLKGE